MNILIKLTCLVGLVIAPILGGHGSNDHSDAQLDEQVNTTAQQIETSVSDYAAIAQ